MKLITLDFQDTAIKVACKAENDTVGAIIVPDSIFNFLSHVGKNKICLNCFSDKVTAFFHNPVSFYFAFFLAVDEDEFPEVEFEEESINQLIN